MAGYVHDFGIAIENSNNVLCKNWMDPEKKMPCYLDWCSKISYLVHTNPRIVEFFDLQDWEYSFLSSNFLSDPLFPELLWETLRNCTFDLVLWTARIDIQYKIMHKKV